jgi:hypothetical protein
MSNTNSPCWSRFLIEGDELFNYMLNNFENMFDGNLKIKHFDIRDEAIYDIGSEEIMQKYDEEIQKDLIQWIKNELTEKRLFEKNNWKPFRDKYLLTYMYLGYRKLFQFKKYYLQLGLEAACVESETCKYCEKNENQKHFQLILYGWKDENCDKLQPDERFTIVSNNIIPDHYWNIN